MPAGFPAACVARGWRGHDGSMVCAARKGALPVAAAVAVVMAVVAVLVAVSAAVADALADGMAEGCSGTAGLRISTPPPLPLPASVRSTALQ